MMCQDRISSIRVSEGNARSVLHGDGPLPLMHLLRIPMILKDMIVNVC